MLPKLFTLYCDECTSLIRIPALPNLTVLDCSHCPITEVPVFPKLVSFSCEECTGITKIPLLPKLISLSCYACTNLIEISTPPNISFLNRNGCAWLENDNIEKLKRLQRFCRNNLGYWRFRRWIKTKEFAEWFYDPEQWGGRASKRNIEKFFTTV